MGVLFYPEIFPVLILSSIFVGIGDLSFFGSLQRIDVSKTQPVAAIYPLFTVVLLILSGLEDVTIDVLVGTIVLIFGIQQDILLVKISVNVVVIKNFCWLTMIYPTLFTFRSMKLSG